MKDKQNAYLVKFKKGVSREIMDVVVDLENVIATRIRNSREEKHTEKYHFRFQTPKPFSKTTSHLFNADEFDIV